MGLFEFLKKSRTDVLTIKGGTTGTETPRSVFKGDLALISEDNSIRKPSTTHTSPPVAYPVNDSKDSSDSVVFLSFTPSKKGWVCTECGTNNDDDLSGCIVCGLRK